MDPSLRSGFQKKLRSELRKSFFQQLHHMLHRQI